jgi:outer membrane protein assembly factor BamB
MAAGAGGAPGAHDESDRRFFAALLIVVGLLGSGVALVHRQGMAHSSRASDACPAAGRGALIGFDAQTGAVRWTNIVPPDGWLEADADTGAVHYRRLTDYLDGRSDRFLVVDRTVDPATGAVTSCAATKETIPQTERNEQIRPDPLAEPLELDGMTVMKWGDGIRATDGGLTGAELWSIPHGQAQTRVGDELVVTGAGDGRARTFLLDLGTGETRWSVREKLINIPGDGTPIVTADPTRSRQISGHDATSGELLWSGRLPPLSRAGAGSPAYPAGDLAIVPVREGGEVAALDLTTGEIRWQTNGGSPGQNRRFSEPGQVGDVVRSPDGRTVIVAVNAERPPLYD